MTAVGVIGGGQLARMMIPASLNLGLDLRVLAESHSASAILAASVVGDYKEFEILQRFAAEVDFVTFDHEHVPLDHLRMLEAQNVRVCPPSRALALSHDKSVMRRELAGLGIPQPRWSLIGGIDTKALEEVGGFPCIAKLPVGGYDGKGVLLAAAWSDLEPWLMRGPVLLEELVDFRRELAQLGARRVSGEWLPWSTVETIQESGVCSIVVSPAPHLSKEQKEKAGSIAKVIAQAVGVVGVLAVEMFEDQDGNLLVNELAMRPHNSGHVFTEQSVTSQFEQHLRAVSDVPLGATELQAPWAVMVNLFGSAPYEVWSRLMGDFPDVKFHSYQKPPRVGRKAGHLVITGQDKDVTLLRANLVKDAWKGLEL